MLPKLGKQLKKMKKLLLKGVCYMVGNGISIDAWKDSWVPCLEGYKPVKRGENVVINPLSVASLINHENHCSIRTKLEELFNTETVEAILRIKIPISPKQDRIIWLKEPKGNFSMKSAYKANSDNGNAVNSGSTWQQLWKIKVHERSKMFVRRIASNMLPTKQNVASRLGEMETSCPLCHEDEESSIHLFCHCPVARAFWFGQC
jgi:hypothetical protein